MGKRGPKKKPEELNRLDGNPGKRAQQRAAASANGEPFAPEWIGDEAEAIVEQIIRSMPPGVYATCDSFLLGAYADAVVQHKAAILALTEPENPPVVPGSRGTIVVSPWVRIKNDTAKLMATLGTRLGLDPAARQAILAGAVPDESKKSKFGNLLGQTGSSRSLNS